MVSTAVCFLSETHTVQKFLCNTHSGTISKTGDTTLSLACANGHLDTVRYLVEVHHCDTIRKLNNLSLYICVFRVVPMIVHKSCM